MNAPPAPGMPPCPSIFANSLFMKFSIAGLIAPGMRNEVVKTWLLRLALRLSTI